MKRIKMRYRAAEDALLQARIPGSLMNRIMAEADASGLSVAAWLRRFLLLAARAAGENAMQDLFKETD